MQQPKVSNMRTYSHRHRGPFIQQGRGLGGVLAAIGRTLIPAVLRTGAAAGKKIISSPTVRDTVLDLGRSVIETGIKHSLPKSASNRQRNIACKRKSNKRNKSIITSQRKKPRKSKYPVGLLDG